jgi:hypothetical protein
MRCYKSHLKKEFRELLLLCKHRAKPSMEHSLNLSNVNFVQFFFSFNKITVGDLPSCFT